METTTQHTNSKHSILRAALVFPTLNTVSANDVSPSGAKPNRPDVPNLASFSGENINFVLFPEGYINSNDSERINQLSNLASELDALLFVGASHRSDSSTGRTAIFQILILFGPDGSHHHFYTKHSTADGIAFEKSEWDPSKMLPTFEMQGIKVGATICHDQYLGLLSHYLAWNGAQVWLNPSYDNVVDIKWGSILRIRAVENRFFAMCTLHDSTRRRRRTHPFVYSPDGKELSARQVGADVVQPLSNCKKSGAIYVVDLDMSMAGKPLDWDQLPNPKKPRRKRNGQLHKPVRVAIKNFQPVVYERSNWQTLEELGRVVDTCHSPVYVGIVPGERILDAGECFHVLDIAKQNNCAPIIWNHWDCLPTDSERLAYLMFGRAIDCCAPILISDRTGIHELIELANKNKFPVRRSVEVTGEVIVDVINAWGLDSAFRMVTKQLPRDMRDKALQRYRKLAYVPSLVSL